MKTGEIMVRTCLSVWLHVLPFMALLLNIWVPFFSAGDMARIYVEPVKRAAVAYAPINVNISIADVSDPSLWSYELKLRFNNSILQSLGVTVPDGHFLTPTKQGNVFVHEPIINQSGGYVWAAATLLGNETGKMGNGTLLTLVFRSNSTGNSTLEIYDVILTHEGGPWMPYYFVLSSGFVEVKLPDFDHDGKVGISDMAVIALTFGSYPSHELWNSTCDVNNDSRINIVDVAIVAKSFGNTVDE